MTRPFPSSDALERALRDRPHPAVEGARVEAAVLACLFDGEILLVRRATHESDPWSGHVGLPGGRHEPDDDGLLATALRETAEELGFVVAEHGRVLGALGVHHGRGRVGGVRIAVFVALLSDRPPLVLSDEIAAAHWVPLVDLVTEDVRVPELATPVPAYLPASADDTLVVWGITHAIIELLRAAE